MPLTAAFLILPFLAACTSINGKTSNGSEFSVYRFATDAAIHIGSDGAIDYTSDPVDFTQGRLIELLAQALQAKAIPLSSNLDMLEAPEREF